MAEDKVQLLEWMNFLSGGREHYPISDDFVRSCQQSPNSRAGYVYYAWQVGHPIWAEFAEPNQKWHFFNSYLPSKFRKNQIQLTDLASKIYGHLQCPELLLWIAEATGIAECRVCIAAVMAKHVIDSQGSRARNQAGARIKEIIPWNIIENEIKAARKDDKKQKNG